MSPKRSDRERKKGTADLLALSRLDEKQRHGYEIAKLIEQRSGGELVFHVASLYTLLKRLERRGAIAGRWVEVPGERRRRFYRLTPSGKKLLAQEQRDWLSFVRSVERITQPEPA